MTDKLPSRPTLNIREALNELLRRNEHTRDKEVADMYLGSDIFVARLRRPQVLEGSCESVERTVDVFDLIDAYQNEDGTPLVESDRENSRGR